MAVNITKGTEGRKALVAGVNQLADAVKITFGAAGRNVVIETTYLPRITKDGVTVARSIFLEDPIENMGASLIRETAQKTVELAGDGTSLSTVLAQALINAGAEAIENGHSPIEIKRGMEEAVKSVVESLRKLSRPVDSNDVLKQIASISANNDPAIGKLIAEAYAKIGNDGVISVDKSKDSETTIEVVEGMQIDRGLLAPQFITNIGKMQAELENVNVVVCDMKVNTIQQILPAMTITAKQNRSLLVIANEIEGTALAGLVKNKMEAGFRCCALRTPEFGKSQKEILQDIAVLTKATLISDDVGVRLDQVTEADLGFVERAIVTKEYCHLIGGVGDKDKIEEHTVHLKEQLEQTSQEHERWKISKRIAKLKNGVAVMRVGGLSEAEIEEKKDRVDDALCATRAAIDEGFVAGGGNTLYLLSEPTPKRGWWKSFTESFSDFKPTNKESFILGKQIVHKALRVPHSQILKNGGITPVPPTKYGEGIDAKTGRIVNMFDAGIVDPTKVIRVALENSVSVAGTFLTTECVISNVR